MAIELNLAADSSLHTLGFDHSPNSSRNFGYNPDCRHNTGFGRTDYRNLDYIGCQILHRSLEFLLKCFVRSD